LRILLNLNTGEAAFSLTLKSSTCDFNLDITSLHLLTTNNITVCKAYELSILYS
jgi:hypothetical protein